MNAAVDYYDKTMALLARLRETQLPAVEKAAQICADRIAKGGLVFMFGSGHSKMMADEMMPRQGCYPGFVAMVESALSSHASVVGSDGLRAPLFLENYQGYAEEILKSFKFGPNDAMIIISTSGVRSLIVEMAQGVKQRGMPLIAMTAVAHAKASRSGHPSGLKLLDLADVVLDNQCPPGDCVVELEGMEWRTGPTSTVTGAMLTNMLRCLTAQKLIERGARPVLLPSHQFVGNTSAEEQLERFYEAYRRSLAHLYT